MLQPVRCIKFGEILLDENRQLLLLCSNCHTDYDDLHKFRQHLDYCGATDVAEAPMRGIFERNVRLIFPNGSTGTNGVVEQQILERCANRNKEFLIYKFNGVKKLEALRTKQQFKNSVHDEEFMDLIKIEEELLDPRWYTDSNEQAIGSTQQHTSLASYNELVEAVTPFVQFKENLKTNERQNKSQTLKSSPKTQISTQIPMQKPKNDYILNDKSSTTSNTGKSTTTKVYSNQNMSRLSCEKQSLATATDTATAVANNSRVIKLPVRMLKVKPAMEPAKLHINNATTQQKLTLQQKHQQKNESCIATPTNVGLITQLKSNITPLPIKTDTIATIQSSITPTLNDTKLIKKPTPSLNYNLSTVQPSPTIEINGTTHAVASTAVNTPANSMQTEQILNKLQNLGLQVKRKLPDLSEQDQLASSIRKTANDKTLELLRKLQSKGMKVKIVHSASSSQRPALVNDVIVEKKSRLENSNGYIEPTYINSANKKLTLLWPQ